MKTICLLLGVIFVGSQGICETGLRELSTDRPDTTESPFTVDRGHVQIEIELATWQINGGHRDAFSLGEMNLKLGVSNSSDVQLVLPLYTRERGGGEGFGDVVLRYKQNLWGNDGGTTAFALMPFIKLPSARGALGNGHVEGGLIAGFSTQGPAGWTLSMMGELDLISDEDSGGVGLSPVLSLSAGHALTEKTGVFLEFAGVLSPEGKSEHEAYFNTGVTWAVTETLQLDTGIRVGLTSASTDLSPFLGLSVKF